MSSKATDMEGVDEKLYSAFDFTKWGEDDLSPIKFHIRSDVFSMANNQVLWAEAVRALHKGWMSEERRVGQGRIERTDCTLMSLALLDYPYGRIKPLQKQIIETPKYRSTGFPVDVIKGAIEKEIPVAGVRGDLVLRYVEAESAGDWEKSIRHIFSHLTPATGTIVIMCEEETNFTQGHAVVFAKDPKGIPIILDAQVGVHKKRIWGRYGLGHNEKLAQHDPSGRVNPVTGKPYTQLQVPFLAEGLAAYMSFVVICPVDPEVGGETWCWNYAGASPKVEPYNPRTYVEIRPDNMTLQDQLDMLGTIAPGGYKNPHDRTLPRSDHGPAFFGKDKKKKKKKKTRKKKKPSLWKRVRSFVSPKKKKKKKGRHRSRRRSSR